MTPLFHNSSLLTLKYSTGVSKQKALKLNGISLCYNVNILGASIQTIRKNTEALVIATKEIRSKC
jgi:hypothetical protein